MKKIFKKFLCFNLILLFFFLSSSSSAQQQIEPGPVVIVYITGIGCHNCAVVDPVFFTELTKQYPNLIIVEYEIYKARKENRDIKEKYFKSYLSNVSPGVPFVILNKQNTYMGKFKALNLEKALKVVSSNPFPESDGSSVDFNKWDISSSPGKVNIWTKNRVLTANGDKDYDNAVLRKILTEVDISIALGGVDFQEADPEPIPISYSAINFQNAVKFGNWTLQWNGDAVIREQHKIDPMINPVILLLIILAVLVVAFSFFKVEKVKKGKKLKFEWRSKIRDLVITIVSVCSLGAFFVLAKDISPDFLQETGYNLPLPVFTFIIAIVDGFNPCNMFVLTCLLALLISTTDSKKRLYAVAFSFVIMVYIFYFLFMAAWLNVFKYISFVNPLRIAIGVIAVIAGLINCKELFFFKKGVSLTISDKQKGPLMDRMDKMKNIIANGSFPLLIVSSLGLATLASLIELPCTAGFPIIYTGILSGRGLENNLGYYAYLALYNFVYVLPLIVIISIFINTFRARKVTQRQMEIIKFIGGIIMLLLGIVLLVNPGLLGLAMG